MAKGQRMRPIVHNVPYFWGRSKAMEYPNVHLAAAQISPSFYSSHGLRHRRRAMRVKWTHPPIL